MNRIKETLVKLYNDEISWGDCNDSYTEEEIREYFQTPIPPEFRVKVGFDTFGGKHKMSMADVPVPRKKLMLLEDGRVVHGWDNPVLMPLPFMED